MGNNQDPRLLSDNIVQAYNTLIQDMGENRASAFRDFFLFDVSLFIIMLSKAPTKISQSFPIRPDSLTIMLARLILTGMNATACKENGLPPKTEIPFRMLRDNTTGKERERNEKIILGFLRFFEAAGQWVLTQDPNLRPDAKENLERYLQAIRNDI